MTELLIPKQKRSLQTQAKILNSLDVLLKAKFFEHISISDISDGAGVSVGTFYRRFKDKNALIPLLYQTLGEKISVWIKELTGQKVEELEEVARLTTEHISEFISENAGIFRTLYLYSRLYPDLLSTDDIEKRAKTFEELVIWVYQQLELKLENKEALERVRMWVFIVVDTMIQKILFADITPAITTSLSANDFKHELTQLFINDLRNYQ